jgi:hypothetical protein
MKGKIESEKGAFEPVVVNITIESISELKCLCNFVGESSGCMEFYDDLQELLDE